MTIYARAHIRNDLPPTDPMISGWDLGRLIFKHMILDSADGHSINESDHPDGYNMLILHPETMHLHWCYSHDFDFIKSEVI